MLRSDAILPGSRCDRVSGRKLCVGFPTRHGGTATPVSESGRLGLKEVARVRARTAPGGRHEKTQGPRGCCSWVLCHHAALWAGDRRRVSWVLEGRGPGRLPAGERVHSPAHTHTHTHTCAHPHTPPPHPHTRAHPQSLTHTKCHPVSSPALAVTAAHGWRLLAVLGRWVGCGGSQAPGHRTLTRAWKGEVTGQPGTVPCLGVLPATALGEGPPTPTTARHPGPGP